MMAGTRIVLTRRLFATWIFTALIGLACNLISSNPASAADFKLSSDRSSLDCRSSGVGPGDTVTLAGGNRGDLALSDCVGRSGNPIVVRNDPSSSGPTVIRGTGGFVFNCENCEYVEVDGTGKWSGAPAGTCGSSAGVEGRTQCGIQIRHASGSPTMYLRFAGSSTGIEVRGVEIDGSGQRGGVGIGLSINDHNYLLRDHPGKWRENIVLERNFIHDCVTECIYLGPNFTVGQDDDVKLRNVEVANNLVEDCGYECIDFKSAVSGTNTIHNNRVYRSGVGAAVAGNNGGGIFLYEGTASIYNNYVEDAGGSCIVHMIQAAPISKYPTFTSLIYNNVVTGCGIRNLGAGEVGIMVNRLSSSSTVPVPTIYNNTIVTADAFGIQTASSVNGGGSVHDNIVAGTSGISISSGTISSSNNRTGSIASMGFTNAARLDFHLLDGSPARDAARSLGFPGDDFDGVSRPQAGAADQGAFEFDLGQIIETNTNEFRPNPPSLLVIR